MVYQYLKQYLKNLVIVWFFVILSLRILSFTFTGHKQLDHYYYLASSLVEGRVDVTEQIYNNFTDTGIKSAGDYAIYNDKYFVYLGIFPAILTTPLILFGPNISMSVLSIVFFAINIIFLYKLQKKFLNKSSVFIALSVFISSPLLTTIVFRGPWYLAGLISSAFGLIFIWYYLVNNRNWGIVFLAPLFLTRPSTLFWFLIPIYKIFISNLKTVKDNNIVSLITEIKTDKSFKYFLVTGIISLLIFGGYNYLRFGDVFTTGYKYFYIWQDEYRIHRNNTEVSYVNQFVSNALYMFVNPPIAKIGDTLRHQFPFYELSRFGVGLVFIMPWYLLYFLYNKSIKKDFIYLLTAIMTIVVILSFTGEGSFQIGPRYANDFFVLLLFIFYRWLSKNKNQLPVFYKLLNVSTIINSYFYFLVLSGNIRHG